MLTGATLDLAAAASTPTTFIVRGAGNVLAGDVPAGHTVRIRDIDGPATLTSPAGFTNHGSLVLESPIGYGVTLALGSGTLTNAADGEVSIERRRAPRRPSAGRSSTPAP